MKPGNLNLYDLKVLNPAEFDLGDERVFKQFIKLLILL